MAKVMALLEDDAAASAAVEQLGKLDIKGLSWELVNPGEVESRLMPATYPGTSGGSSGGTRQEVGAPLEFHESMRNHLRQRGVPAAEADYYSQRMKHESVLLIASVPQGHRDVVAKALEAIAPTRVSED